ncbi:MAG: ABC transporter permease [bacterium]|nr:ABC transporter permease [bacterium]
MLTKLSLRNARRSIKDYLIYLITMSGIAALMFAFDAMICSKDIGQMCENASIMAVMIGLATVFIIIIVSWLIHYMVRFMLERRSKEFGTYLILGMDQKKVATLYLTENLIMGVFAFLIGVIVGFFLEQGLLVLFYQLFSKEYQLHVEFSFVGLMVSFVCFFACYLKTLRKSKKMFSQMTISDFMRMEKENEQIKTGRDKLLQILFPIGILLLAGAYVGVRKLPFSFGTILGCLALAVAGIYCFYCGLASLLFCCLDRKGKGTYKKQNLFIWRQLSSKLHTMRFTMGTISLLLCVALMGGSIAMMFAKYQEKAVANVLPFDVIMYHEDIDYTFEEERKIVASDTSIAEELLYRIYRTEDQTMIHYLALHNDAFGGEYTDANGQLDLAGFEQNNWAYYDYDTYMLESDYNELRNLLGLTPITLGEDEYALQVKPRVETYLDDEIRSNVIALGAHKLTLSKVYTEDFSQNGHNGADFVIVVPDEVKEELTPYYRLYAAKLVAEPSEQLKEKLDQYRSEATGQMTEDEYMEKLQLLMESGASAEEIEEFENRKQLLVFAGISMKATGSDQIISLAGDILLQKADRKETMFAVASIIFPLVYIGLVFLCIALTILAVQQLSDSGKYRFRYDVLRKLGMSERQIESVVGKQLLLYYMIPALFAVIISSGISILAGNAFVKFTGAEGNGFYYFGLSLLLFFGVYVIYFLATYVGFVKNVRANTILTS